MNALEIKEWETRMAMRAFAREERRKEAAREAHRARKLKATMPWVAPTADERAQFSSRFPQKLD
jgi:hypothetical protein